MPMCNPFVKIALLFASNSIIGKNCLVIKPAYKAWQRCFLHIYIYINHTSSQRPHLICQFRSKNDKIPKLKSTANSFKNSFFIFVVCQYVLEGVLCYLLEKYEFYGFNHEGILNTSIASTGMMNSCHGKEN